MWEKVGAQVRAVFEHLDAQQIGGEAIIFAYEPVWAIGTGESATPEDAQEAIGKIRDLLREIGGEDFAREVRILYGGLLKAGEIDGVVEPERAEGGPGGG